MRSPCLRHHSARRSLIPGPGCAGSPVTAGALGGASSSPGKAGISRTIARRESPTVPARTRTPGVFAMPTAAKNAPALSGNPAEAVSHLVDLTDRMHGLLMDRADELMGCTENSPEEAEL